MAPSSTLVSYLQKLLWVLTGNYARDKDAACAAIWLAEHAAELKAQKKSLLDDLNDNGLTLVVVTHDARVAHRADRVIVLQSEGVAEQFGFRIDYRMA